MEVVVLTPEQVVLRDWLRDTLQKLRKAEIYTPEERQLFNEMGQKAHQLHLSLKASGHEPLHHRYMIKNRGISVDDPKFYYHIHPVEDLLKFIEDPKANWDPEDVTLNCKFNFPVYTRRWGHKDHYRLTRTGMGWYVEHQGINGECDREGRPFLYRNFSQDCINYPEALPNYMAWLWRDAAEAGLSVDEVQRRLQCLADWVSTCERATPEF